MTTIFERIGLGATPVVIAPLAGVTDPPMRRLCTQFGADLCYTEMISATALLYDSERTFQMLQRYPLEQRLGLQLFGSSPDQMAQAISLLEKEDFLTVDINMGCPVKKVVKTGSGSAMLRDPEKVLAMVRKAREATAKPLSVKIRSGWDRSSINAVEVAQAIEQGGAAWLVVHGRTRADGYGEPVDLEIIRRVKAAVSIPVLGNGNLFTGQDAALMQEKARVDGWMIARGVLGNPWIIKEIKTGESVEVSVSAWLAAVEQHIAYQRAFYGDIPASVIRMRKQLLWYCRGWPHARTLRSSLAAWQQFSQVEAAVRDYVNKLIAEGITVRSAPIQRDYHIDEK